MILTFKICTSPNCGITITDFTQDQSEYTPDEVTKATVYLQNNRWKYRDTATLNILEYHPTDTPEIPEITHSIANLHVIDDELIELDECHLDLTKDGYYTVHHIVLPTKEGIDRMIEYGEIKDIDTIKSIIGTLYYLDGDTVMKNGEAVEDAELILVNTENTSLSRETQNFFSICQLWTCYINYCKQIFNSTNFKCKIEKQDTFNRDFVWMTINILTYHMQFHEYSEAQRVLESIHGCGGFCNEVTLDKKPTGCGCGR